MTVLIFGKEACQTCKGVKDKFKVFLEHWKITDQVKIIYYNVDTVDGLCEAAYKNATDVPVVIIEKDNNELVKWSGQAIISNDFKPYFKELIKEE